MPFGHWSNWDACITDMMGPPNNYNQQQAEGTCGKLKKRLEGKEIFRILKSSTGRRVIAQYVHVEGLDKQRDIIPLNRMKDALEDMKTWNPRFHNVHYRHKSYQIGFPLWEFKDADGDIHRTEADEYGLYGVTEIRNDGYPMADQIWQKLLDGEPMGASIGVTPLDNPLTVTRELIKARGLKNEWLGAKYWDVPLKFIEAWSETEYPANQYVTAATILSKEICEPCVEARADWLIGKGIYKFDQKGLALEHAREYLEFIAKSEQVLPQETINIKKPMVPASEKREEKELDKTFETIFRKYFPS